MAKPANSFIKGKMATLLMKSTLPRRVFDSLVYDENHWN
jgi:hypothetical protein